MLQQFSASTHSETNWGGGGWEEGVLGRLQSEKRRQQKRWAETDGKGDDAALGGAVAEGDVQYGPALWDERWCDTLFFGKQPSTPYSHLSINAYSTDWRTTRGRAGARHLRHVDLLPREHLRPHRLHAAVAGEVQQEAQRLRCDEVLAVVQQEELAIGQRQPMGEGFKPAEKEKGNNLNGGD